MMEQHIAEHDDDMPAEIDFSKGTRGKFAKPGMSLKLPAYVDPGKKDGFRPRPSRDK